MQAVMQAVAGHASADAKATAALEAAAGLWAKAFASATVEPITGATSAVTPPVLGLIARDLIRRGESLHYIDTETGAVRLRPVGWWDVRGDFREEAWTYQITLSGASSQRTMLAPGADLIHCRYATDPATPWLGRGPLHWASATAVLAADLESQLTREVRFQPVGQMVHFDHTLNGEQSGEIAHALSGLSRSRYLESRDRVGGRENAEPDGGHKVSVFGIPGSTSAHRIGPNPPAAMNELRGGLTDSVLAACSVPQQLIGGGEGAGQREAWRRFLHGAVSPVARIVEHELRIKLDTPTLRLRFDALAASDISGRARAFQSMVKAGMDKGRAEAKAGLAD